MLLKSGVPTFISLEYGMWSVELFEFGDWSVECGVKGRFAPIL